MKPLSGTSTSSLPGPEDITRVQLSNGITVLTRTNPSSPSVVIAGYLVNGSLLDPDEKLGRAYFTAASLMRGTQRRSFQQIFDSLESIGATLGLSAGTHSTGFSGRALVEDLPTLLELLRELVEQPSFPAEQVERLRAQMLTYLAIRAQDTGDMASLAFEELVYPGHPFRRPDDGYPETIQAITREDLVDFHRAAYGPKGMVIVVVGAVEPLEAIERVEQALGSWSNPDQLGQPDIPPVLPVEQAQYRRVAIPGKTQADLVMGTLGPARRTPDYFAASLGNNILGQFGMMGRIGDVVREQSGLAYYAYTSLNAGLVSGTWEVTAGINPANIEKTIALVRQEIERFVREPVSADELADSQANYIGRLPLAMESNQGMASALLNIERFDLGLDYYRRYPDLVRAVSPESILETARRWLTPDRLAVAVAGPGEEAAAAAESLLTAE